MRNNSTPGRFITGQIIRDISGACAVMRGLCIQNNTDGLGGTIELCLSCSPHTTTVD